MYSSLTDVADSGLEKCGRFGVLSALSLYRNKGGGTGYTPVDAGESRISEAMIALYARLSPRQVRRVLKELRGETGGPILIVRTKKGSFHAASVYRFYDDRFSRVAHAMRIARRAIHAGLAKRVAVLDLTGQEATAENCMAMIQACISACKNEDKDIAVATLEAMLCEPILDIFKVDVSEPGGRLETDSDDTIDDPLPNLSSTSLTHTAGTTPRGDLSVGTNEREPSPNEGIAISTIAKEAGANPELLSRLREASWRREDGKLIIVTKAPWVRDQLLGMNLKAMNDAATMLGLIGVEITLERTRNWP